MVTVDIEYCVPCGLLDEAQETAGTLLEEFGEDIDRVSLITGDGGVFKVQVDGELVYDSDEEGYDVDVIVKRVGESF